MSDWVTVAKLQDLLPGERKVVEVEGVRIAVFNVAGEFHAVEDVCSHDGGDLAGGRVEGDSVVCPRHGARFSLHSGAVLAPPAYEALAVFPLRVIDGVIQVRDDRWE